VAVQEGCPIGPTEPAGESLLSGRRAAIRALSAFAAAILFCAAGLAADRPPPGATAKSTFHLPSPIEDDANLHDVQFVGTRHGWAVGDHGVIWHSQDGGESWEMQSSGISCPLYSVAFLSDRVGWVAGGGTVPFTRRSYGVVLHTTDGGQTWRPIVLPPAAILPANARDKPTASALGDQPKLGLPRIRRIKFFSPEEGVAVGEGTGADPSGAFATDDGGSTWRPLPGKVAPGWLAADFLNPDAGALVGSRGSLALAVEGKIMASRFESRGVRGLYDVALGLDRTGWLVGDGGVILRTMNAGLVWQAPLAPLPEGARDIFDFRAVCFRGDKVWLAGQPGSAIWHSPDNGRSWLKQKTGQPLPLAALHFSSDDSGWAAGALGTLLRTEDGGRSWKIVRGSRRRLAILGLFGSQSQVSLGLIAELSGEAGYRGMVSVVARQDDGLVGETEAESSARLDEAVTRAGGSAGRIDWQWPLVLPGLERDADRLIADWNRRTENRLDELLLANLVRELRTWRPSVLVIEQPESGNALVQLIGKAALKAVEQAGDSTRFLAQQELAGLEPWKVQRIFVRLPEGSTGEVNVDPFRYLPRLQSTTSQVAATAEALFLDETVRSPRREAFRLVPSPSDGHDEPPIAGGWFGGLAIAPGSAARRELAPLDDTDLETRLKIAARQRNFTAYAERYLDDDRHAGQLIAQLPEVVRGMSDSQAAWQIEQIAERYQAVGQWELGELALIELVERFPDQPAARCAMQRLVQLWGSAEITWRRLRKTGAEHRRDEYPSERNTQAMIERVEARLRKQSRSQNKSIFDKDDGEATDESSDRIAEEDAATIPAVASQSRIVRNDLAAKIRYCDGRALRMAKELARRDAASAAEPAVQFPVASIQRRRTAFRKSDDIYERFSINEATTLWSRAAEAEIWLASPAGPPTGPVAHCGFTPARPVLDGVLSDRCWEQADELPLTSSAHEPSDKKRPALAKLCWDSEYLYFAASLPRAKGVRTDGPIQRARHHDEQLDDFDRVMLSLDIDRDRVTYFNFTIDQRGCTSDACWQDPRWNPSWLVAVDGDAAEWRIEAAIPLNELTPWAFAKETAWAVGITRIIPAIGVESWTQPAAVRPHPENFGIVQFDTADDVR